MKPPREIVVVGAGHAGIQVCSQLRASGFDGRIHLISEEAVFPYQRPPLSKGFLTKGISPVLLRPAEFYAAKEIELTLNASAVRIDRDARRIILSDGTERGYDILVLATGARNRSLPVAGNSCHVHSIRTVADAESLRGRMHTAESIVVVGGGFIGLEVAAAAKKLGKMVSIIEAQERLMVRAVSLHVSEYFRELHVSQGVDLRLNTTLRSLIGDDRDVQVETSDGAVLKADAVVVGVGVVAEDRLAREAGLATANGVVVDETLRTSDPAIYAIGDCANFPMATTGNATRLESVQNAVDQASHVASAIMNGSAPYATTPWFWSDQYDARLQIAGVPYAVTEQVLRTPPDGRGFTVFSFSGDHLVSAESIDRPTDHVLARKVLDQRLPFKPEEAADPNVTIGQVTGRIPASAVA